MKYLKILFMSLLMSLFSTSAVGETNSWALLALQDLAAIKTELQENHPGAVDPQNPQFAKWMEQGYVEASQFARRADSFESYYFSLLRYTSGFNDNHLSIFFADDVKLENNFWPGFAVSLNNDQFIVSDLSNIKLDENLAKLPQPGDVLIACDGKSANQLFTNNILPFYGIEGLAASERANAPRLMFDEGNPYIKRPSRCTFEDSSGRYNLNLNWRSISSEAKEQIVGFVVRGNRPEISFKQINSGVFWITLSSFTSPNELQISQLQSVIKTASKRKNALQTSDIIVFDVRGNDGGSSTWGKQILESIWGEGFIEGLPGGYAEAVDWRVSTENISSIRQLRPRAAKVLGENNSLVRTLDDAIAGMEQATKLGEHYYHKPIGSIDDEKAIHLGKVIPKIYLLSDGACASGCLDFADLVLSIPNAELVGTETSADTPYIENRAAQLPSKKASLWLSMKVYRGRMRRSNEPYRPTHQWNGNSWDTKELQDWVLELSAE